MASNQDFPDMSQDDLIKMFNQTKGTKELNMTDEESNKMLKNFQNPEFVKLFNQFARELQTEQGQKDVEQLMKDAEAMAGAQSTVDSAMNLQKQITQKERQMAAKGKKMTAKDRLKIKQQQKAAEALQEEMMQQKEKQEKLKRFEELYKKQVDQRKLRQAMATPNQNSHEKPSSSDTSSMMTAEDYKRMEDLIKQAEQFAAAREKTPEQLAKEIAEAAKKREQGEQQAVIPVKETVQLPYKEVFIQDIEYADYMNGEQLNLEKIRGYKAVQLRASIPDGYNKETVQLEVTKHEVKLQVEVGDRIYRLNKVYQFQLNENSSSAKMRMLTEDERKKYGCSQYLEITINIDRNAMETIKYYTNLMKERQFVEAGPSVPKTPEEIAQEVVSATKQPEIKEEPKSKFEISAEIKAKAQEYEQTQANVVESQPVQAIQRTEDGTKSLMQKYAENLKKQQKTVNLDNLQGPVSTENKIFNFAFRNRIFYMQNRDLTWQ